MGVPGLRTTVSRIRFPSTVLRNTVSSYNPEGFGGVSVDGPDRPGFLRGGSTLSIPQAVNSNAKFRSERTHTPNPEP